VCVWLCFRTLKQTQQGLKIVIISCICFAIVVTLALVITIAVLPPQVSYAVSLIITCNYSAGKLLVSLQSDVTLTFCTSNMSRCILMLFLQFTDNVDEYCYVIIIAVVVIVFITVVFILSAKIPLSSIIMIFRLYLKNFLLFVFIDCDSGYPRLHWLPVAERIQYKLCLLVHKSLLGHMPEYISNLLMPVVKIPGRSTLRALSHGNLVVPRTHRQIGDSAFSVAALRAWNRLPTELKLLRSTVSFRRDLKTFLFDSVYGHQDMD